MDPIALVPITIGVIAMIGVVFVAMNGQDSQSDTASRGKDSGSTPAQETRPPEPAPGVRQTVQSMPVVTTTTLRGEDPLLGSFLQALSCELETLRQQQQETERRLKLMDGIASLMQEMQADRPSAAARASSRSNGTAPHRPPSTRTAQR